ncbi:beta-propeller domain-containing protein [Actinomadura rifamycini]|uniref:beta-propeller domain-containing protein n=1 Tax=Actinomadura rifamycini TaxID=31962 RepID=UPI00047DD348|nr:beta-propeller domain-containing protein [Actinomadura rifamycini]
MRARTVPAVAMAAASAVAAGGCALRAEEPPAPPPPPPMALVGYRSCERLLDGLRRATAMQVGPDGPAAPDSSALEMRRSAPAVPGAAAEAAPVPEHSLTNAHEPGADEPDLVKTDGRRIVALGGGGLHVIDPASRKIAHTLDLPGSAAGGDRKLLMDGDRVLVLESRRTAVAFEGRARLPEDGGAARPVPPPPSPPAPRTRLTLVDVAGAPRVVATLTSDTEYVDARRTGGTVHVVVRSTPRIDFPRPRPGRPAAPGDAAAAIEANRRAVLRAPLDAWLPAFRVDRGGGRVDAFRAPCDRVSRPAAYGGSGAMLSVLTLDLAGGLADPRPMGVAVDGSTVYGNGKNLYITGTRPRPYVERSAAAERTDVHMLALRPGGPPEFAASGSVPGRLLNQYALSEHNGHLRVATTSRPDDARASSSALHVLRRRGPRLDGIGRVGGLGKTERIHAVRFTGPTAYVVTFRRTDPLYALDLSDPRRPRATGELKITGYSAYLHPVADGRLLGVGQDADASGRVEGLQVSLFDVAGPPRRIDAYRVPGATSSAEADPHAFLYWARTGLTVLPVREPGGGTNAALVLKVTRDGVARTGDVGHPGASVLRSLVVGDALWTFSDAGARASDAATLADRAWLPYG